MTLSTQASTSPSNDQGASNTFEYDRVITHLKRIANMSKQCGHLPMQKRALLDMYFAAAPQTLEVKSHTQPALVGDLPSEWFFSRRVNPTRRILYVHGGSWMAGSSASHRGLISRIADITGCLVLAINYRLAPECPFPQGLEDIIQAFKWLSNPKNCPDFSDHYLGDSLEPGSNPQTSRNSDQTLSPDASIFMIGDSAGGNLVLSSALAMSESLSDIPCHPYPTAIVALSPAVDLTFNYADDHEHNDPILHSDVLPLIANNYVQEKSVLNDPWVSPIKGELSTLPPTLIQTGTREILRQDCYRFYQQALSVGTNIQYREWANMPHVFQGFAPLLDEANEALQELADFIAQF